ncbi:MAG: RsmE family RNA methyltransferase [Phycisphaerales bacterium]
MPREHRLFIPDFDAHDDELVITGEEADHARKARRASPGDRVTILTGAGILAECEILDAKRDLRLRVREVREIEPERPMIEVFAATPKGPRADDMVDALSQAGAHSWTPLETKWSVVEPRKNKMERMGRIAAESAKQCLRAWTMRIGELTQFRDALAVEPGCALVIADQSGSAYTPSGAERVRLLIGPEGGWTDGELAAARDAGALVACFGPHVMRIEVAAPIACAIVHDQERR